MDDLTKILFNRLYNSDYDNNPTSLKLIDLVSAKSADSINFYPGNPSKFCCKYAYFISLKSEATSKLKLEKSQFVSLEKMLEEMFNHIFIKCLGVTSNITFICDEINTSIFDRYSAQFRLLKTLNIQVQIIYFNQSGPQDITILIMPR